MLQIKKLRLHDDCRQLSITPLCMFEVARYHVNVNALIDCLLTNSKSIPALSVLTVLSRYDWDRFVFRYILGWNILNLDLILDRTLSGPVDIVRIVLRMTKSPKL